MYDQDLVRESFSISGHLSALCDMVANTFLWQERRKIRIFPSLEAEDPGNESSPS